MTNVEPTTEAIAKLPKWARDHIQTLKYQRDEARTMALQGDFNDSPVTWTMGLVSEGVHLPARADVRFRLSSQCYLDVGMREVHALAEAPNAEREFVLRVNAGGAWSRMLVHPQASNAVEIMGRY